MVLGRDTQPHLLMSLSRRVHSFFTQQGSKPRGVKRARENKNAGTQIKPSTS